MATKDVYTLWFSSIYLFINFSKSITENFQAKIKWSNGSTIHPLDYFLNYKNCAVTIRHVEDYEFGELIVYVIMISIVGIILICTVIGYKIWKKRHYDKLD